MKLYYSLMLWLLRHEIAYARGTGRSFENVQQLSREIAELELAIWRIEIGGI